MHHALAVEFVLKEGMQYMKLRIKFNKYGPVRFIGHLDVMRFFQKAIRRAGIDVAYSQGFSPHQIMSFAAPLSVGLTSNGEYMDVEVNSIVSCQDVKERLNSVSVPGIEVLSVKVLPEGAENAMASVAAASYTVRFRQGREPKLSISQALPVFLAKEQILYTKQTQKGTREIDLKSGIYELSYENDCFTMLVCASSAGNVKPIQIIEALLQDNGEALMENALIITREDTFLNKGTNEDRVLVPLDDIGYII